MSQVSSNLGLVEDTVATRVLAALQEHYPGSKFEIAQKAFDLAFKAHDGQLRESGQPYIVHPVAVAYTLAQMGLDEVTIAAAFLHDTIEDTNVTAETIAKDFGSQVASIVEGVTRVSKYASLSRERAQEESLRKLVLAMASDLRVVLVKLADRLHNMRTLQYSPRDKQIRIARQTLEVYAPLARRLGVGQIHRELEDLAFMYLEPEAYENLSRQMRETVEEREATIAEAIEKLSGMFKQANIKAHISGRTKHVYSTWKKMQRKGLPLDQIYDVVALRALVETIPDCYSAIGVVHTLWPPVPGEFDDYIATPKSNTYQSLHTAVIGPYGLPLEVQIRTVGMHEASELGVAAHFRYKEGSRSNSRYEEKLAWVRSLLEGRDDDAPGAFVERLTTDVFTDQVFVFTPKGAIKELPTGATALDFAYRVHTDVGHHCVGAKVNRRMVPLDTLLHSGDIVEILINKASKGPSRDWLGIVKTTGAREKIRQFFKKLAKEENIRHGRLLLEKELGRSAHLKLSDVEGDLTQVASKLNLHDADSLLAGLGYGDVKLATVMNHLGVVADTKVLIPAYVPPVVGRPGTILVGGQGGMYTQIANCCKPIPEEAIVGYVTRGRGVSVHQATCQSLDVSEEGRRVAVSWVTGSDQTYPVSLLVVAQDRNGLVRDLSEAIAGSHVGLSYMSATTDERKQAHVKLTLQVRSLEQLYGVLARIERLPGIVSVVRQRQVDSGTSSN